ncbi:MAG: hypothetical protein LBJ11_02205 [Oscillospiraceae bacterium]|jgi:predicted ribosomally synthesized peptide with SipW-like signal peptide|nr:hypothetical protein [Oscillospiraceae bacterium]
MKVNRKIIVALALVLAVATAITGSTFAWFTATDGKQNHFETASITDGSVTLYELFREPYDWTPGQEIKKDVGVNNVGRNAVLARISFEEALTKPIGSVQHNNAPYVAGQVPVQADVTAYAVGTGATDWKTVASRADFTFTNSAAFIDDVGAAAAATLEVKEIITPATATSLEQRTFSFYFWNPIASTDPSFGGKNQSAQANFRATDKLDPITGALIGFNLEYVDNSAVFYAYDSLSSTAKAWGKIDYTGALTPAVTTLSFPNTTAGVATSTLDSLIQLKYDATSTDWTAPTANKWYYNIEDGWFYFIGLIPSGTISPLLLNGVKLDGAADESYASLIYDLYVNMEAIQPIKDAMSSTTGGGWSLNTTVGSEGAKIIAALDALNVFIA